MQAGIDDLIVAARDRLNFVQAHIRAGNLPLAHHDLGDILFWIALAKERIATEIQQHHESAEQVREEAIASWREVLGGAR